MKVVQTVASLRSDHGGPSRSVTALAEALAGQGRHTLIVCAAAGIGDPDWIVPADPRIQVLAPEPSRGRSLPWARTSAFAELLRGQVSGTPPVLIHDHGLWLPTNHASARVASERRVPRIVSPRGMLSEWSLRHRRAKKRVAWLAYQRRDLASAALIHATSADEVDDIRRVGLRGPVALIPNGVAIPAVPPPIRPSGSRPMRRALFLSRIHPKKGIINLVEAWALARPQGWELLIAGPDEGGHRDEVVRAIDGFGAANVSVSGPVADADKWRLYASAELFVLPTFSENFGLVVAEALAAGVPVITTRGAPWQELETHRCGWWIDVGTAPLRAALEEATRRPPGELQSMGARGRALVEAGYTWPGVASQMAAVYDWVCGLGAPPPSLILT